MRKIAATLLLITVCFGPNMVYADAATSKHKHSSRAPVSFKAASMAKATSAHWRAAEVLA